MPKDKIGGRRAGNNNTLSYEEIISRANDMKYGVIFGTGIDVMKRENNLSSITSYKISDLSKAMNNIDETIVRVSQGMYDKRIKALEEIGYEVIAKSKTNNNEKTTPMLVHIKRRK